jgi:hypothetical protein
MRMTPLAPSRHAGLRGGLWRSGLRSAITPAGSASRLPLGSLPALLSGSGRTSGSRTVGDASGRCGRGHPGRVPSTFGMMPAPDAHLPIPPLRCRGPGGTMSGLGPGRGPPDRRVSSHGGSAPYPPPSRSSSGWGLVAARASRAHTTNPSRARARTRGIESAGADPTPSRRFEDGARSGGATNVALWFLTSC